MPKEIDYTKTIPKIYRRKFEDIGMLFFVEAQKQIVPTITVNQSLCNYAKFIGIDNCDIHSMEVTLSRLRAEFIDMNYEAAKKNK
jgi:hypothetical protein